MLLFCSFHRNPSQQIEVIQLLTVAQDIALNLTGINPSNKVFHVTGDQERRIIDNLGTNADMALLDESRRLDNISIMISLNGSSKIHSQP